MFGHPVRVGAFHCRGECRDGVHKGIGRRVTAVPQPDAGQAPLTRWHRRIRQQAAHCPSTDLPAFPLSRPRRRRFLVAAALAATSGAGAATAEAVSTLSAERCDADLTAVPGTWQTVVDAAGLAEGDVLPFDLTTVAGFVQQRDGHLTAVSGYCTHQGCRLTICDSGQRLVCPCHGATFTPDGTPLERLHGHRTLAPLPRLAVRLKDGRIEVHAPVPAVGEPTS